MVTPQVRKMCKECQKQALPTGTGIVSYAARKLGYCRDCYEMKFPMRKARSRYKAPVDSEVVREFSGFDSDTFNPDSPWDWYEYFFPAKDR